MPVLINVSVLDGVSEKDVAWNIAVDEPNTEMMGGELVVDGECEAFGR